jgi:hypothetical protein
MLLLALICLLIVTKRKPQGAKTKQSKPARPITLHKAINARSCFTTVRLQLEITMATIKTLLNPLVHVDTDDSDTRDRDDDISNDSYTPPSLDKCEDPNPKPSSKRQKMCKDAAVFKADAIRGQCRYPPHEEHDDSLATQHQMFEVYPVGKIAAYPRHIPYNSEKKLFLERTGRDCFEGMQNASDADKIGS